MKVFIESFAHKGVGVARIDNKIVFVENAIPNEVVDIEVVKNYKDYSVAVIRDVIKQSMHRVMPVCPYYGLCGGCNMQHIDYYYQVELKKQVLKTTLKRIAGLDINNITAVQSKQPYEYRRRVRFRCSKEKWGYLKKHSHDIIDIDSCAIADKRINNFIKQNICIERQLVVSDGGGINKQYSKLDLGGLKEGLYLTYKTGSFVQVNKYINEEIIKTLINEIGMEDIGCAIDFYGGFGNFSIPVSILCGISILNVELNRDSIQSFKKNINRLGLGEQAKAVKVDLSRQFELNYDCNDCVILDPPRIGAKNAINFIVKHKPQFVFYISCEVSTLSRDIKVLNEFYDIERVVLFDMFPQTHHFETMIKLKIRESV